MTALEECELRCAVLRAELGRVNQELEETEDALLEARAALQGRNRGVLA